MELRTCVSNKFSDAAASPGTTPGKQQLQSPASRGRSCGGGRVSFYRCPYPPPRYPRKRLQAGRGGGWAGSSPTPPLRIAPSCPLLTPVSPAQAASKRVIPLP